MKLGFAKIPSALMISLCSAPSLAEIPFSPAAAPQPGDATARAGNARVFSPRLVITGIDADGKSTFVYDGEAKARQEAPSLTMVPMWQIDKLPAPVLAEMSSFNLTGFMPPPEGFRVVMIELPPDKQIGNAAERNSALADVLAKVGASDASRTSSTRVGFHQTESAELITILSGEVYAIMEDGEKLLRAGDTLIQRGTNHAWNNRSSAPCRWLYVAWPIKR